MRNKQKRNFDITVTSMYIGVLHIKVSWNITGFTQAAESQRGLTYSSSLLFGVAGMVLTQKQDLYLLLGCWV